jgi:hypothetical protein
MKLTIRMGLFCVMAMTLINQFAGSHLLAGLLAGAGLCLLVIGMLPQKTADALRSWKRSVFLRAR